MLFWNERFCSEKFQSSICHAEKDRTLTFKCGMVQAPSVVPWYFSTGRFSQRCSHSPKLLASLLDMPVQLCVAVLWARCVTSAGFWKTVPWILPFFLFFLILTISQLNLMHSHAKSWIGTESVISRDRENRKGVEKAAGSTWGGTQCKWMCCSMSSGSRHTPGATVQPLM